MAREVSAQTYVLRLVIVAAAYAAAAYWGLTLVPEGGTGASLVWPAAAVALAAIYFWGYEMWPALTLSFFALLLSRAIVPPLAIGIAIGNTLEAALGVYLLRFIGFSPMFTYLRDSIGLVFIAIISTSVSAAFITLSIYLFSGSANPFNTPLLAGLWIGHAVSLVSFGPFILRWLGRLSFTRTPREVLEGTVIFGSLATITYLIYWTPYGSIGGISLIYIAVMFYIWSSLRTGPRGVSLALAMNALIAATGVLFGDSPISHNPNLAQSLFGLQILTGTFSVIFLLFTSTTEERKEAVQTLEQHVGQLESALERIRSEDQAKSDFIAILAHELRNPLSPILSGLEILKNREGSPPDILRMMGAHVHTIARLLDDLLDIARITQKKFRLERSPIELHAVIGHALEMVSPQIEGRQHTLRVTLPQEEIWLNADPVRLTQVFANVLGNAAKYTNPGGTIELTAERRRVKGAEQAVVRIKDNGTGIAPERLSRVFDAFGGVESAARRPGGLRIGLSLAKRMTELHHGTIEVKSAGEGRGSEFIVTLPLTPVQMSLTPPAISTQRMRFSKAEIKNHAEKGTMHILVCDDNHGAAQTLGKLLENNGHDVVLAYDGTEALARIKERTPAVALLDIGLPDMDGYDLARTLKREHPNLILVALTGYGQNEDKQKARAAGFSEHLVKPVSIVDVERILSELGIRG
ncbi:MAG: ATP-binding protein [Patescibacteria group bacterium]